MTRSPALAAVATICLVQLGGCSREPPPPTLTGGKPLSYWMQALRRTGAGQRRGAVFELGNVGPTDPAVIPALTAALQDRDARVRSAAILALVKSPKEAVGAPADGRGHGRPRSRSHSAQITLAAPPRSWRRASRQ